MSTPSPQAAAIEAARYLDLDPSFFLEQAALAGLVVFTDGKLIHFKVVDEDTSDWRRIAFLWTLMKSSRSGKAIRELLIMRGCIISRVGDDHAD